jgi:putative holliday junction resolvase
MLKQKKRKRVLAVDVGLARIGLAISDEQKIIATPLTTLQVKANPKESVSLLVKEIEKLSLEKGYEIDEIIIGLPLRMDGSESKTTTYVRGFAEALKDKTTIAVRLFDERLTSIQAERSLMEANFSRKKRAQFVDQVSAVILLQSFLATQGSTFNDS